MKNGEKSILKRILAPLLIIMTLQAVLIFGSIIVGGILPQMRVDAYDIFAEKVASRKNILSAEMLRRWSSMEETVAQLGNDTRSVLMHSDQNLKTMRFQDGLSADLLSAYAPDILYLLRKNSVTGAFVLLEGGEPDQKSGLYFRDPDPGSNPSNYTDLLATSAPSVLTKRLGIALDASWQPYVDFTGKTKDERAFYEKPFQAALEHPLQDYRVLGYWSRPFCRGGEWVIAYSVPLLSSDGVPFGVLGIDLSMDYLCSYLPAPELNHGAGGGYLLAVGNGAEADAAARTYEVAAYTGDLFKELFLPSKTVSFDLAQAHPDSFLLRGEGKGDKIYANIRPLALYPAHTPFADDSWALIGLAEQTRMFAFVDHFTLMVAMLCVAAVCIGIAGTFITAKLLTEPIGRLSRKLRSTAPDMRISIARVGISEIDELLDSLESLSGQVADSASRLSTILEMAGVPIGAFEYNQTKSDRVQCAGAFFSLLEVGAPPPPDGRISIEELGLCLGRIAERREEQPEDSASQIYRMGSEENPRWISVTRVVSTDSVLGVITDVTQEMLARRRIEYDRDYDLLTNLYNRRAFHSKSEKLFASPERMKIAALVMIDLDNLKFINDTYGHDYGDEYIRLSADVLRKYAGTQALVSRLSGDEFVVLFYGYENREEIRIACAELQEGMRLTNIYLPDHTKMQIRASAGVAWYPEDSLRYEELLHYADFAMYMVKKTHKGEFIDFDMGSYNAESYLLHCREELNTLIDGKLVRFQFQPIVDAHTGALYAFEALMRPQTKNIKSPLELLSLARSQSKLAQLEVLTFQGALASFCEQPMAQSPCLLFINSIANQIMSDEEVCLLERGYASYMSRIVVELTEEERPEKNFISRKEAYAKKWGAEIALDDFGVGYNGEGTLLHIIPNYIKLDMSIVQNIHADDNRLRIVKNILSYSHERGVRVIAEGIETRADLAALIEAGVDYLQGYYIGRPTYTPDLKMEQCRDEIIALNESKARV